MIYNLNELGIRYNPLYEAFIILEKNSTLSFDYNSSKKQQVFLIIQYNSSTKPYLSLKINNKFVNDNLLVLNTQSINKLIGFRTQLGPFEVDEGNNKFEVVCKGSFPFLYLCIKGLIKRSLQIWLFSKLFDTAVLHLFPIKFRKSSSNIKRFPKRKNSSLL